MMSSNMSGNNRYWPVDENGEALYSRVVKSPTSTQNHQPVMIRHNRMLSSENGYLKQEMIIRSLESRYGGKELAHHAATVIQRCFRAWRLQGQFSKLLTMAMSTERLNKRLSLIGPPMPLPPPEAYTPPQQPRVTFQSQKPVHKREKSKEELFDEMLLRAAGIESPLCSPNNNYNSSSQESIGHTGGCLTSSPVVRPSARPSRRRQTNQNNSVLRRSYSMKMERRPQQINSNVMMRHAKSRDDLDLDDSPPPPPMPQPSPMLLPPPPSCPPLRGEEFYRPQQQNGHDIYVTRDSLYASEDVPRSPTHSAPRPPQRTVSFLAGDTLPRKVSLLRQEKEQLEVSWQLEQQGRVINSDSNLYSGSSSPKKSGPQEQFVSFMQDPARFNASASADSVLLQHNRSVSSPAAPKPAPRTIRRSNSPLPPPPYVSPPKQTIETSPDRPLPPPPAHIAEEDSQDMLPPPPPPITGDSGNAQQVPRPPCDSASSSSSIDSGYGRSSVNEQILKQQRLQAQNNQVQSPVFEDAVFETRTLTHSLSQVSHQSNQQQNQSLYGFMPARNSHLSPPPPPVGNGRDNLYPYCNPGTHNDTLSSVSEMYGMVMSKPSMAGTPVNFAQDVNKVKKTVRIQTPDQQLPLVTQQELLYQSRSEIVEDEVYRRRQYRVGLNLFNLNPEVGMEYLLKKGFLDYSPLATAKFLLGRKGLSKQVIGNYLSNLQRPFNLAVLHCFIHDMDFSGLHLDIALRQLQAEVTLPGEAQKIEKFVEVFAQRYIQCNAMFVAGFRSPDTIFVLSYAIVLLNTDLHSRAVRPAKRMKKEDFLRNLSGVNAGADLDPDMLSGVFDRIKASPFRPGSDHVAQVAKVEETILGRGRNAKTLADPGRRLVCFCRLTEVPDLNRKEKRANAHQRGIFLFNDLLINTKAAAGKKGKTLHQFRGSLMLNEVRVSVFNSSCYAFGIQLQDRLTGKIVLTLNARSQADQQRFVNDLQESIAETAEMEKAKVFLNSQQSPSPRPMSPAADFSPSFIANPQEMENRRNEAQMMSLSEQQMQRRREMEMLQMQQQLVHQHYMNLDAAETMC